MKKIYFTFIICFISIMLTSCISGKDLFYRMEYNGYLDTASYVIVEYNTKDYTVEEIKDILNGVKEVLLNVEKEFSIGQTFFMKQANIEESTTMLINRKSGTNEKVKVSDEFLKLLEIGNDLSIKTNGLFDLTIGSLSRLWDISQRAEYCQDDSSLLEDLCKIPIDKEIKEAISLIDYKMVEIDKENQTVYLPRKGMMLDFGGIAKGYAADKVWEYLNKYQFSYSVINLGGNVKVNGTVKQSVNDIKIYINNPFDTGNLGYYYPKQNTGGVTSGIYERYITYQGVKYHHILNPKTGYPCSEEITSVTIMSENSTLADALSTSVFMLGVTKGLELINSIDGVETIIVTNNKKVYVSNNIDFISDVENIEIIR